MLRSVLVGALMLLLAVGCEQSTPRPDRGEDRPDRPDRKGDVASSTASSRAAATSASAPTSTLDAKAVAALNLSAEGVEATEHLAAAPHFGGWAVGAAGSPTPPVEALRTVLREPKASQALQLVLQGGTPAGQLMALAGLFDADPIVFKKHLPTYRAMSGEVRLMTSGCAPGGDPTLIKEVVEQANAIRLAGPTDDLMAWSQRNPGKPIAFDIAGGGYTAVMRAR